MASNVLITGSTGMVGKGVLLECLKNDAISQVFVLNRSSLGMSHPKLKEVLLQDFSKVNTVSQQFDKLDACYHCMGISAVGMSEKDYTAITFDTTKALVDVCYANNPNMVFTYVSGQGTDATEKGSVMWARVKGKTENYILNKGFGKALMFRPGIIIPMDGIKSKTPLYNFIYMITKPFYGIFLKSPKVTTTRKIGSAMINAMHYVGDKKYFENTDINQLA